MVGAKIIAVFAMLPWLWGLFQVGVLGNWWSITYLIPYLLIIEKGNKKTTQRGTNVCLDVSNVLERRDACVSTDDIVCVKNINVDIIELNKDCCRNIVWDTNPFLDMLENLDSHGDVLATNPFLIEDARQLYPSGNPFLDINHTASILNTGEGSPALLSTNPFIQDFSSNQIVDISIFFPNGFGDVFTDIPCSPTDSDIYCKEWIEQHRKCFFKTARSFSIH
ncbi:hypothetical protein AVEN_55217-1 [Araneus ventricosus]|uniref:Uncharacterized protein n=1 Tax=Araneus ventricosus TaxID=182803 RepID=A0A4Y2WDH1_ARAVE|nr:hypothetical protein AVEN_55217-1 [Araneus ventricosus]